MKNLQEIIISMEFIVHKYNIQFREPGATGRDIIFYVMTFDIDSWWVK